MCILDGHRSHAPRRGPIYLYSYDVEVPVLDTGAFAAYFRVFSSKPGLPDLTTTIQTESIHKNESTQERLRAEVSGTKEAQSSINA